MTRIRVTGQHSQVAPLSSGTYSASGQSGGAGGPVSPITIGEALEATALTAGKKPVDWSDAAAIQANATEKLQSDKAATKGDAEGVKVAEMSNDPTLTTHPAGVAATVATAARLNDKIAK
ncbi:late embryogenesis abundant protein 47-like [Hibiscus syriacus]|uniref:late embryogenesis abundant protein 47-like n=1 Tax=Hibiscus syriacus TaxID=106335 RepID=UPI001920BB4E|nr:late embryogenesis abundant protein 47-like [Hibiscus syriacus]